MGRKVLLHSDSKTRYAFVIGIELSMDECPRVHAEGSARADALAESGSTNLGGHYGGGGGGGSDMDRASQFMRGDDVFRDSERAAEASFAQLVSTSASSNSRSHGSVRVNDRQYLNEFQEYVNGNAIPVLEEGEFDSELDDEILSGGFLTRWESMVMARYWKIFTTASDPHQAGEIVPALVHGVTVVAAQKYLLHDLRTVRLRCALRNNVPKHVCDDVTHAYTFAAKYFG